MNSRIPMPPKGLYEFGPFRLDRAKHLLLKDRKPLQVPPKAFEILVLLVEKPGTLLTKDELLHAVWPDTFVEENNLTQYVSMLRKTLSDGADDQKYIQTVPRLGYRFAFDVNEIVAGDSELLVAKHTRTRIVMREEEEVEGESPDDLVSAGSQAGQIVPHAAPEGNAIREVRRTATGLSRNSKRILVSALTLVAAAAAVFFYPTLKSHRGLNRTSTAPAPIVAPVKPRYSVAVLGFKNLSGRSEDNWLSTALAEMLTTELSAGGQLRIVPGDEVQRIRSDINLVDEEDLAKPTLNKIRNRVSADLIVSGSFVEVGREPNRQIRLDLRLQDTAAGETVYSAAVTGRTDELFALVSRSGAELRSKLGVPMLSATEGAQDQAALPSTPEAARLYSEGVLKLRVSDAPAAQKLLSRTVAVDPNFALGHSALATAWSVLGYDEKAKSEGRRALDLSLNLSREEHLLIAGQYSELTRDWDRAVATYQELFNLFPDNVDYGLRFASAQTSAGKGTDALATLEKLHKLSPPSSEEPQIDLAQATAAESIGDFKQESEAASRAVKVGQVLGERLLVARSWTKKSWAMRRLGQPQEAALELLEAKRAFSEAGDVQGVGSSLQLIGSMQSEQGGFADAARSYQEAITIFRRIGDRRSLAMSINGLATVRYERGDFHSAKALYQQYYEIEREVGSKVNAAGALGNIANIDDAQGNLAEARRLNEESVPIFAEVGDQRAMGTALGNIAILMYEQGDLEGARKKFEEALDIKRKIGYQRGIAYDLAGLGEIYRAEGNLAAAQQKHEESLTIRNQLGEKHNAAASRVYLAVLALENQKPAEAEKIAREATLEFQSEKSAAAEAGAEEVVARTLLAQGKYSEAKTTIGRVKSLSRNVLDLPLAFDIAVTSARISVAGRSPSTLFAATNAKSNLESSLVVARRCGYLEYEYKLSLVLGEFELDFGKARQGRARLEALVTETNRKGFGLIARHASAGLKAQIGEAEQSQP